MSRYFALFIMPMLIANPVQAGQLVTMHNAQQAKEFCAGGGVVWMDLTSGRYVYQGSKYYGKGKNAAYVCEVQAIQAGGNPAPNSK